MSRSRPPRLRWLPLVAGAGMLTACGFPGGAPAPPSPAPGWQPRKAQVDAQGLVVLRAFWGPLPAFPPPLRAVGALHAIAIPATLPVAATLADQMVSPWGLMWIQARPGSAVLSLTTWQGQTLALLRQPLSVGALSPGCGAPLAFAVAGNSHGAWGLGTGIPLFTCAHGAPRFLWWNARQGTVQPIPPPAAATLQSYPATAYDRQGWVITWGNAGGWRYDGLRPDRPPQSVAVGFSVQAAGAGQWLGSFAAPAAPIREATLNPATGRLKTLPVTAASLAALSPLLARQAAVVEPLWLPVWGPSYAVVAIHQSDHYQRQQVLVVAADGRHRVDLPLRDAEVWAGNGFLVAADWKRHRWMVGFPGPQGGWQWRSGGSYRPHSLVVYALGVSWQRGGLTWVWPAPAVAPNDG